MLAVYSTTIKKKTDVCGTLQLNRKDLPQDLKTKKLKKGEIIGYQGGKVTVLRGKGGKKDANLISRIHTIEMREVTNKREKTKSRSKCVIDCSDTMGGACKVNQHLTVYSTPRKRRRKYYKISFPFIGLGFVEFLHFVQ